MQQSQGGQHKDVTGQEGLGYYPLSNMQFDVITLIANKSKALEAYDKYIRDCKPRQELVEVIERIKSDDTRHIVELKKFLNA